MRQDARSLLEKLQQTDFAYRDFDEQEDEGEPWPLLDTLLRHPALARSAPARSWPQRAQAETPASDGKPASETRSISRLFGRYDARPQEAEAKPENAQPTLRTFLDKLADEG